MTKKTKQLELKIRRDNPLKSIGESQCRSTEII